MANDVEGGALLVNKPELLKLLGVSRATFHRHFYHADGFPKPVVAHGKIRLWRLSDVQRWVAEIRPHG